MVYTFNVIAVDGDISIRVNRWPRDSPYPAQLLATSLPDVIGQSELAMLQEVCKAVYRAAERSRFAE